MARRFYGRAARLSFIRDFGLGAWMFDRLGLEGKTLEIFEDMIEQIHRAAHGEMPELPED